MGQCVEVCRAGAVAHPQPFLSRRLKAGIVTLTLCTQGVCSLETEAAAVNGKPVIRGDDPVFNATPVFLPVIPVFVVTRASTGFGLTEGAAEFLPGTIIVGGFAIFVHSQSSITDQVTCRKSFALGIAFFEGDKSFPIIDRFHGVVDAFRVVALIREKGTPLQREDLVGCGEDVNGNVKKCAVGKHPKSEKHGNTAQFSEVERSGTQEKCGGIGSGCRLRLRPLPVLRRRQSQRVARIDPNAVVVDKNIAENDRFDLFSR